MPKRRKSTLVDEAGRSLSEGDPFAMPPVNLRNPNASTKKKIKKKKTLMQRLERVHSQIVEENNATVRRRKEKERARKRKRNLGLSFPE